MRITFIRHAESVNNYLWYKNASYEGGSSDAPITDFGRQQAQALSDYLTVHRDTFAFDRIYISPFLRTLQTAAAFSHLYEDIPQLVWPWIYEGGGVFSTNFETGERIVGGGLLHSEMQAQFPQFSLDDSINEEGWYHLGMVEPGYHRSYRANYVLHTLLEQFGKSEEHIALVSHGGFHNHLINAILGDTRQEKVWIDLENTAMSGFYYGRDQGEGFQEGWWRIEYLNRCEWLGSNLWRDWSQRF